MPFVTQCNPSVPNLQNILMSKWHLIENQPLLSEICREPPLVSYRRGKFLKDILVRAKLLRSKTVSQSVNLYLNTVKSNRTYYITKQRESCLACQPLLTSFRVWCHFEVIRCFFFLVKVMRNFFLFFFFYPHFIVRFFYLHFVIRISLSAFRHPVRIL